MIRKKARDAIFIVFATSVFTFIGIALYMRQSNLSKPSATALENLFGTPPCSLPCWQGITPGVTTSSEAIQKLHNSVLVSKEIIEPDKSSANWHWESNNKLPDEEGNFMWSNGIVQMMELTTYSNVPIGEVINRFGPPEKIDVIDCTDVPEGKYRYWCITLYYAKKGIEIHFTCEASWNESNTQITPSNQIEFVRLFEPSSIDVWLSSIGLDPSHLDLQDWKGYGNLYDLYIR